MRVLLDVLNEINPDSSLAAPHLFPRSKNTEAALREFWDRPAYAEIAGQLGLPHPDHRSTVACLDALLAGRTVGPMEIWGEIARQAELLAETDAVAGSLVAIYAAASWEGSLGRHLLFSQDFGDRELHWGWSIFPLALARALLAANAIWAARRLASTALETLEYSDSYLGDSDRSELNPLRALLRRIERRLSDAVEDLAADLQDACHLGRPSFRPEVAALLWNIGDVLNAELLRTTEALASQSAIRELVQRSLRVLPFDPLLQRIWLGLRDRPPFDLRKHHVLYGRISRRWATTQLHALDDQLDGALSRVFASAVVEHFSGGLTEDGRQDLAYAHTLLQENEVDRSCPEMLLRVRALITLASHAPWQGADDQPIPAFWAELAAEACAIVEARRQTYSSDLYDRSLDIPFYYLPRETPEALADALAMIEQYRSAGMWFWRCVVTPPEPRDSQEALPLLEEERKLIQDLRDSRFQSLLPTLPMPFRRLIFAFESDVKETLDVGRTPEDAQRMSERVHELVRQLAGIVPEYASARMSHGDVDEFVGTLAAKR